MRTEKEFGVRIRGEEGVIAARSRAEADEYASIINYAYSLDAPPEGHRPAYVVWRDAPAWGVVP